ncbi:UDP-N-acetylmuramoyl-L-alanyl-D-glutamate--2,6-diaminopimelate ligase [Candidatus Saccharibacteria bacterium]|nr:UDP-N-acetylmuramoyl-L-alanyl-D-glutamate--2,6-diaminopimelate ligase [Candidatus Saccharibacteria bacterium]
MNLKDIIPGYNTLVLPYHFLRSAFARRAAGYPDKKLRIIGVTGTNGKTTTSFMIWKMLNTAGLKTGLMTTVAWGVPGLAAKDIKPYDESGEPDKKGLVKQVEHMTTVDPVTLNRRIKIIAESGAEFLVLEVTSHALTQYRTLGFRFDTAVMTNVTHEHLDYHKTFKNYVAAKCKLFSQANFGIINTDDPSAKKFISALHGREYSTYGIQSGHFRAKSLELAPSGVKYTCGDLKIKTNIPGKFNIYNSLAAVCVGKHLRLDDRQIVAGIAALEEVEGRMNRIDLGQKFDVIVDFAHTPDAFEKVFSSINKPKGRIISLFGGAGRRDETTRAERGEIAGKYSDICVLTEDDSRDENPEDIIADFEKGCKKAGLKDFDIIKITDRKTAIEYAIKLAQPGDLVLILGKGHEKTILRADGPHPFEDLKVTSEAIKQYLKSN